MATAGPYLVAHLAAAGDMEAQLAKALAATRALRIDLLCVDRRRYRGTAGELALQRMVPDPYALEMDERLARVREANTETRLETMRRVMALPPARRKATR
jgi:hypothetical protein